MLVAKGEEINTVWFEDRPLRGYGHFSFDEITGKAAWKKLFNGDKPNSVLSGQGRSLVFETGHFQTRANGTYASRIKLIGDQANQDVITGQWKKSSLLIDSTSASEEDSSNTIVEGLAGLLVVGGGLVLYKKIRANRVQEAAEEQINELDQNIANAEDNLADMKGQFEINEAIIKENTAKLNKLQEQLSAYQKELANAEKQLELAKQFGGNEEIIKLWQDEVNEWQMDIMRIQEKIEPVSSANEELIAKSSDLLQDIKDIRGNIKILENQKEGVQKLQTIIEEELEEDLDDVANDAKPFETEAFKDNQAAIEGGEMPEVKLLDQMILEDANEYEAQLIKAIKDPFGSNYTESIENILKDVISEGQNEAYDALAKATCSVPVLAMGAKQKVAVGGGFCTEIEGIDPVVDLYAEEFTIEENMIFKGSHVFTEFRSDLAEIGYEAEIAELTEFVAGPEFAGEAGELIGAFTEGTLVAEEAVGALDIASIGLGGEAFVDGLALEVGGDALLGEIALDILEIAVIF